MEKQSYYLIILLVVFVICIGVFWFQFNNDVPTFIMLDATEVNEGDSFSGILSDAYGYGVANQTITYHQPGYELGTLVDTTTDENGEFTIENAQFLSDAGDDNYYGDFSFAGNGKYQSCSYEGNVTVKST